MTAIIENAYVRLWVENGIIHEFFKLGIDKVTLSMAKVIVGDRLKLSNGVTMPALIYSNDLKSIEKEARIYFSSEEGIQLLSASAILVDNYVSLLAGKLFLTLNKPPLSVEIFRNNKKALEWLSYFKDLN